MKKQKIDEMISKVESLSYTEKLRLARAIMKNKETRQQLISGAWCNGNFELAIGLMSTKKIKFLPLK